jgi:hypothetical protein
MEYDNVNEMYCTNGHMVESPFKVLYRDPLPNVVVDDVEDDKKISGHTAYKAYSKDCSSSNDVNSGDDYDSKTIEAILSFATKKSITKCFKRLIIDYTNRILLQILCVKSCSYILMVHLTNKQ